MNPRLRTFKGGSEIYSSDPDNRSTINNQATGTLKEVAGGRRLSIFGNSAEVIKANTMINKTST